MLQSSNILFLHICISTKKYIIINREFKFFQSWYLICVVFISTLSFLHFHPAVEDPWGMLGSYSIPYYRFVLYLFLRKIDT